jgi:hypothetical protein
MLQDRLDAGLGQRIDTVQRQFQPMGAQTPASDSSP